jgi:hypothetical protein
MPLLDLEAVVAAEAGERFTAHQFPGSLRWEALNLSNFASDPGALFREEGSDALIANMLWHSDLKVGADDVEGGSASDGANHLHPQTQNVFRDGAHPKCRLPNAKKASVTASTRALSPKG